MSVYIIKLIILLFKYSVYWFDTFFNQVQNLLKNKFINFQNYMSKAQNINFSNEKLNLNYLIFNLPKFRARMLKVAKIFHKQGFNSRTYNADTEKYSMILYEKTFTHWLTFTFENELRNKDNLYIYFKASNSHRIYFFIKEKILSIHQLSNFVECDVQ